MLYFRHERTWFERPSLGITLRACFHGWRKNSLHYPALKRRVLRTWRPAFIELSPGGLGNEIASFFSIMERRRAPLNLAVRAVTQANRIIDQQKLPRNGTRHDEAAPSPPPTRCGQAARLGPLPIGHLLPAAVRGAFRQERTPSSGLRRRGIERIG